MIILCFLVKLRYDLSCNSLLPNAANRCSTVPPITILEFYFTLNTQSSARSGRCTCWRLRLPCSAAASFSSCFTLILMMSCRTFSRASLVSMPAYSSCLRESISGQTFPDSQAGPSGCRAMCCGVGGEAREGAGTGPERERVFIPLEKWLWEGFFFSQMA